MRAINYIKLKHSRRKVALYGDIDKVREFIFRVEAFYDFSRIHTA